MCILLTLLQKQAQPFDLPGVFHAGGYEVNAGSINGAVAQQIRQLDNILAGSVKYGGKQMPEVVRENL